MRTADPFPVKLSLLKIVCCLLLVCLLPASLSSCKRKRKYKKEPVHTDFVYDDFADKLQGLLLPGDSVAALRIQSLRATMLRAYELNDHDPIWLAHGYKPSDAAILAIQQLESLKQDGLDLERYQLTKLKQLQANLGKKSAAIADAIAFDTSLSVAFVRAAADLMVGIIAPKRVDSLWFYANDSSWNLANQLANQQAKAITLDDYRSKLPTYTLLRAECQHYQELSADSAFVQLLAEWGDSSMAEIAIDDSTQDAIIIKKAPWLQNNSGSDELLMQFQAYAGVKPTGAVDSATRALLLQQPQQKLTNIAANLERIRWMLQDLGNPYVLVDIPLMELFLRRNGTNAMHMRVVVGKFARQTPSLRAIMANIVLNPQWGVPPTILKKDVLPGVEKSGATYLSKKGLKVFDRNGKRVNSAIVTSKNYRKYQYRQDPGNDNALGVVKFNLPNKWDIYLHDTPHRGDFGKADRALSSGCIRLHKPKELALFVFNELEGKKYTMGKLDTIVKTHKTQWNVLKNKIPVHIAYLTAFEDSTGKHIRYVKDIYNRDEKFIALLAQQQKTP
jgi:L,D-transpeptidase YcbB